MRSVDLIINADDLGASDRVNDATFDLMERGRITSATLMATGAALDDAVLKSRQHPTCSFGVHLNVTSHRPLAPSGGLAPLLDQDGIFTKRIFTTRIDEKMARAVYHEWCAQVEKVLDLGVPVTHLDSHEHVHTLPGLFLALKRVQRRFRIRRARLSKNVYDAGTPPGSRILPFKKWLWNTALRRYYRTNTTEGFSDFKAFFLACREDRMRFRTVEVMVHPGVTEGETFMEENQLLESAWQEALPCAVRLISYAEL